MTRHMLTLFLMLMAAPACTYITLVEEAPEKHTHWRTLASVQLRGTETDEGSGGAGGAGSSTTSATTSTTSSAATTTTSAAGGAPACQTCALALGGDAPSPCDGAAAGFYHTVEACACQGACAAVCAGNWCGKHSMATGDCYTCLADKTIGCGVERAQCIAGALYDACVSDAACGLGFSCQQGDPALYRPSKCAPHLTSCAAAGAKCEQPQCSEVGRYGVTLGIAVDIKSPQHLLWQRVILPQDDNAPVPGGQFQGYASAKAYCEKMVIEGIAGWRLPTAAELLSLTLNPPPPGSKSPYPPEFCSPALDQAAFPNTLKPNPNQPGGFYSGMFWSSTPFATGRVGVSANLGVQYTQPLWDANGWAHARCVHDPI